MEITLNTSGIGFDYNFTTTLKPQGLVSIPINNEDSLKAKIKYHLDAIMNVFLSEDYDDHEMGYFVEDHLYAIRDILDAD